MRNLIEYARKVEREMYSTATDLDHYYNLLAQKCYRIHRELDEKRRTRQQSVESTTSSHSTVGTCTTTTTSSQSLSQLNQSLSTLSSQLASPPNSSLSTTFSGSANRTTTTVNGNCSAPLTDGPELNSFTSQDNGNSENDMSRFEHYLQSAYNRHRFKSETGTTAVSEPPSNASSSTSSGLSAANSATVSTLKTEDNCKVSYSTSNALEDSITTKGKPVKMEPKVENTSVTDIPSSNDSFGVLPSSSISSSDPSVPVVKPDESKWKKWSREELLRHFLHLHEEIYDDKFAEPFRAPVDPVVLHIPDYFQVIKEPMDLTTIRNNLEDGKYTDPWQVVEHYRLMFNNAWLYNKKTSKVYKMCTKVCFFHCLFIFVSLQNCSRVELIR